MALLACVQGLGGLSLLPSPSARGDWNWQNPPLWVNVQSTKRNHVFYVGDPVSFQLSRSGASSYVIRDYFGNVVEQGAVSGLTLGSKVSAPGWYKLYLLGSDQGSPWGTSVGSSMFCILRNDANFPKMPAAGTWGGDLMVDEIVRGVFGYGPQRHKVDNASNADAEIARLDRELALDLQYYTPFDPARNRVLMIAFPNGTTDQAGVRKIVERFKGVVKYWEARNEPNFAMSATSFVNNELRPFYQLVKSVDPSLKVLGPGAVTVGPPMAGFNEEFFRAGGAQYIDAFSFHCYNNVNGDLTLARQSMAQIAQWLRTYNKVGLELWQTEQGAFGPHFGSYQPRLQARWTMLQLMVFEQHGIPKEHNHYWYDKNGGYWDQPCWVENEDGTLNPVGPLMRVYSEELYGTNFSRAFDFGDPGNKVLVGNLFTGANKQVAAFMTSGETQATVELNLSSATSVKVVSAFGNEQTLPVVNGKVSVRVSELPTYVEFSGGISVTPWNWGANLAAQTGTTVTSSGSSTHPIDPSVSNPIAKVANGRLESWYWTQSSDTHPWESNFSSFPGWVQVQLPSAQLIDRVVIHAGIPWQWDGSLLDYELQADQNGQWVSLGRIQEPANTFSTFSLTNRTTVDSLYSERSVFTHAFAPITTQRIRLVVNDVTVGGAATSLAKNAGAQGGVRQLTLREIEVYRSGAGSTPVTSNVPPTAVNDSASCYRDASVSINVLGNDGDSDKGPQALSVVGVGSPQNGRAVLREGKIVYLPNAGFSGPDTFPYTVSDGADVASATVSVNVLASTTPMTSEVNGLSAEYFDNADLTGSVFTRIDPWVDFAWGGGSPDPKLGVDTFSVRWTGQVQPKTSEVYTFFTDSDDGVRLWVDGKLVIDRWNDHALTTDQASVSLVAGRRYDVKLEYYENAWDAQIGLQWSSPTVPKQVIPASALFAMAAPVVPVNAAPVAVGDSAVTNEGVSVTIPVLLNDSDPDNGPQALRVSGVGAPRSGTALLASGGGVVYTPFAGFYGADAFGYTITDGSANATAQVAVSVNSTAKAYDLSSGGLSALLVGSASGNSRVLADGNWELNASGLGAAASGDAWRMEGTAVSGDFRAVARVQGFTAVGSLARMGIMVREGAGVGAREVVLAVTPSGGVVSGVRSSSGGGYVEAAVSGADGSLAFPNAWLMLERIGDTVRLSVSTDGKSYRPVASSTLLSLAASVQAGLVEWSGSSSDSARAVVSDWAMTRNLVVAPTGQQGLLGTYFSRSDLTQPVVARVDETVNYDWALKSPHPSMAVDQFSVRWTGLLVAPTTENYTLYTQTDDGVRLWVNGQRVVDRWNQRAVTEDSVTVALQAGVPVPITLEYYEATGLATARLLWSSPSLPKQVIPATALRPMLSIQPLGSATASTSVLPDGSRDVAATGAGLGGAALDQGGWLSQGQSGDFQLTVRVRGFSGGTAPKGAVLLREGLAAGDRFAGIQVGADGALAVVSRGTSGGPVSVVPVTGGVVLPNAWLLVERRADTVSVAVSGDDVTFRKVGTVSLPGLPSLVQAGMFVGSGSPTGLAHAVLGDYELAPVRGAGLTGQYFGATDLSALRITRTDAGVDFNWGNGAPSTALSADRFSVRWTGRVTPRYSETYTFSVQADDGMRLWVDGRLVVDNWKEHRLTETSGTIALVAGQSVDVRLEYYENAGSAAVRLLWSSATQKKEVIPAAQLSTP